MNRIIARINIIKNRDYSDIIFKNENFVKRGYIGAGIGASITAYEILYNDAGITIIDKVTMVPIITAFGFGCGVVYPLGLFMLGKYGYNKYYSI